MPSPKSFQMEFGGEPRTYERNERNGWYAQVPEPDKPSDARNFAMKDNGNKPYEIVSLFADVIAKHRSEKSVYAERDANIAARMPQPDEKIPVQIDVSPNGEPVYEMRPADPTKAIVRHMPEHDRTTDNMRVHQLDDTYLQEHYGISTEDLSSEWSQHKLTEGTQEFMCVEKDIMVYDSRSPDGMRFIEKGDYINITDKSQPEIVSQREFEQSWNPERPDVATPDYTKSQPAPATPNEPAPNEMGDLPFDYDSIVAAQTQPAPATPNEPAPNEMGDLPFDYDSMKDMMTQPDIGPEPNSGANEFANDFASYEEYKATTEKDGPQSTRSKMQMSIETEMPEGVDRAERMPTPKLDPRNVQQVYAPVTPDIPQGVTQSTINDKQQGSDRKDDFSSYEEYAGKMPMDFGTEAPTSTERAARAKPRTLDPRNIQQKYTMPGPEIPQGVTQSTLQPTTKTRKLDPKNIQQTYTMPTPEAPQAQTEGQWQTRRHNEGPEGSDSAAAPRESMHAPLPKRNLQQTYGSAVPSTPDASDKRPVPKDFADKLKQDTGAKMPMSASDKIGDTAYGNTYVHTGSPATPREDMHVPPPKRNLQQVYTSAVPNAPDTSDTQPIPKDFADKLKQDTGAKMPMPGGDKIGDVTHGNTYVQTNTFAKAADKAKQALDGLKPPQATRPQPNAFAKAADKAKQALDKMPIPQPKQPNTFAKAADKAKQALDKMPAPQASTGLQAGRSLAGMGLPEEPKPDTTNKAPSKLQPGRNVSDMNVDTNGEGQAQCSF